MKPLMLDARPAQIELDLARTAALVVDMQNDFASSGGMFDRARLDIEIIRRAIQPTASALVSIRKASIPVVYVKMGYKPDLSDLGPPGSPNREGHLRFGVGNNVTDPNGRPSRILIRDTWNTQVIDELRPQAGDLEIYKNRFSAFFETELHDILKARGIRWLIVTGCTTSICVESTIRDAMFRDYSCVLLEDCTAELIGSEQPRTNQDVSLLLIESGFGWISSSRRLIGAIDESFRDRTADAKTTSAAS